jgi:CubicO group peptidase (beta-lactamase class C family)
MAVVGRAVLAFVALSVVLAPVLAPAGVQPSADPQFQLSTPAEPPDPSNRSDVAAFVDGVISTQLERHDVPGATVAVVAEDELVFAKGYGYADATERREVRADRTLFRVGSVSKLIAYTAVMQQVERDRLSLDADVNSYLEESPVAVPDAYDQPVTLEHLGTHTAGFEDVYRGVFYDEASDLRPLGRTLADTRPARVRPPGELTAYSNWGAALAGHVVAERTDLAFATYADRNVFTPLGMDNATFRQPVPDRLRDQVATGHRSRNGEFVAGGFEYVGIPPAGAMSVTATDMAQFMRAHLGNGSIGGANGSGSIGGANRSSSVGSANGSIDSTNRSTGSTDGSGGSGRILDASTATAMHRRHFSHDPRVNGMAYGFIEMDRTGERIVGHGGATELFHTQLVLLPERDVGLFVSYNAPGGAAADPALVDAFLDRYFPAPSTRPESSAAGVTERATRVTGEYRSTRVPVTSWWKFAGLGQTLTVRATDGGDLLTSVPGGAQFGVGPTRWVEVEPLVYRAADGDATLVFEENENGRVTRLYVGSNPTAAFVRPAWYATTDFTLFVFGGSVAALLASGILWAIAAIYRWRVGLSRWSRETWLARGIATAPGVLALVFLVGLAAAATDPYSALAGTSELVTVALLIPYAVGILAVGTLVFAVRAWRERAWTRLDRLHYSILAFATIALVSLFVYWEFLPP